MSDSGVAACQPQGIGNAKAAVEGCLRWANQEHALPKTAAANQHFVESKLAQYPLIDHGCRHNQISLLWVKSAKQLAFLPGKSPKPLKLFDQLLSMELSRLAERRGSGLRTELCQRLERAAQANQSNHSPAQCPEHGFQGGADFSPHDILRGSPEERQIGLCWRIVKRLKLKQAERADAGAFPVNDAPAFRHDPFGAATADFDDQRWI